MGSYVACSSLLEGTMTRNRTKVWDLNYVTVIMSQTTKAPTVRLRQICVGEASSGQQCPSTMVHPSPLPCPRLGFKLVRASSGIVGWWAGGVAEFGCRR